jgi:hypothetical protein
LRTFPNDPAENFLINGSFEIPGVGIPYGWGSGHWGIGHLPWAVNMDRWRRHWHLDTTVAWHGTTSLCLENTPNLPLLKAISVWTAPPPSVEMLVLSAWLKSDRERLPVRVECTGEGSTQGTTVEVGREWKQVVLRSIPRRPRMAVILAPQAPGRLWIDAVQLQAGDEPTTAFHPNFIVEAIAQREAKVDWSPPRRTAEVAAGRSVHGPVRAAHVEIDEHGRFLLNGQPYIPHALGLEFVSDGFQGCVHRGAPGRHHRPTPGHLRPLRPGGVAGDSVAESHPA